MRLTELFLEPMISTGEERSQFEDILSRLGGLLERQHAEQVVDQAQVLFLFKWLVDEKQLLLNLHFYASY